MGVYLDDNSRRFLISMDSFHLLMNPDHTRYNVQISTLSGGCWTVHRGQVGVACGQGRQCILGLSNNLLNWVSGSSVGSVLLADRRGKMENSVLSFSVNKDRVRHIDDLTSVMEGEH